MAGFQKATDTATPWPWKEQSKTCRSLTKSLVCYVSSDDVVLDRRSFLQTVIDRIVSDLDHNEQ